MEVRIELKDIQEDAGGTTTDVMLNSRVWIFNYEKRKCFFLLHPPSPLSPPPLFIHSLISPSQSISPSPLTNALFHVLSYFCLSPRRPLSLTLMSHGPFVGPPHFWG